MLKRTLSALGAVALTTGTLALAAPLHAATADDTVTVRYSDLNLARADDVSRLERRVKQAAGRLCNAGNNGLAAQEWAADCTADVLSRVVPQVRTAIASRGGGDGIRLALRSAR